MKQLIAVINPNDTDELLHSLQEVTNIDKLELSCAANQNNEKLVSERLTHIAP